jgi:hypothetical protein
VGSFVIVQIMDTGKKRHRGQPQDGSGPEFKKAFARRAKDIWRPA